MKFLLVNPQDETINAIFYLPYPSEPSIVNGVKVTKHFVCCNPKAYLFDMEGFTPGEEVHVTTANDSDSAESGFTVSPSGKATSFVAWLGSDQPSGLGTLTVRRTSGTSEVQFSWNEPLSHLPAPLVVFTVGHSPTIEEIEKARDAYLHPPSPYLE